MPKPDPLPSPRLTIMRRFWRTFRLLALLSIVIAALAVVLVVRGDPGVHVHMMIATALGVGLSVMLAIALMSLIFLSNREGHDAAAHHHQDDHDPRP